MEGKRNWWNSWQHYRKLSIHGGIWDKRAFSFIKGLMPRDKLERYSRKGA